MHDKKYVFSQMCDVLPFRAFDSIVRRYKGNYRVRHFSCKNQLLCMVYGQISSIDSLSGLVLIIKAHSSKKFHLGFGKGISKANLSKANAARDWRIYRDFYLHLIDEIKFKRTGSKSFPRLCRRSIFAFDSTTIKLCKKVFKWAEFRGNKSAIKMHTLYDVSSLLPTLTVLTNGCIHDVNGMDWIRYEPEKFYIFDRAYFDSKRLLRINEAHSYFIVRSKSNLTFKYDNESDQIGELKGYPQKIRCVKFYVEEKDNVFILLTNNFTVSTEQIVGLYKYRWKIEDFFKWMKQHLKIKSFWGTTENAVKTQIYISLITYAIVVIVKERYGITYTMHETLLILRNSLLDNISLEDLLKKADVSVCMVSNLL